MRRTQDETTAPPPRGAVSVTTFYSQLADNALADDARAAAGRIRARLRAGYIETGRDLIEMKGRLGHGHFGAWLRAEFDMTERTAENYMNAATFLEGKSESLSEMPAEAVYALAAPSAPPPVVKEVIATIEAGTKLRTKEIKAKIADAIEAERRAKIESAKSREQIKRERKARESRAARDARKDAEAQARKEKDERDERQRTDRLRPLVTRMAAAIGPEDLSKLVAAAADWNERDALLRLLREARP